MAENAGKRPKAESALGREVGIKAARKLSARRDVGRTVWFGLGMMGLIGWSVAIPTLAGTALGLWLDRRYPGAHSWTLMLLFIGLIVGCINAWHWVTQEDRAMRENGDE